MRSEIRLIHQLSQNKIFEVHSRTEADLKAWLASSGYVMEEPLVPLANNRSTHFKLKVRDSDLLFAALANDCNRFAQAAIETMWSIGKVDKLPKSTGWASIQMYYSAFFAAHAILRIFGRSCTQLDKSHVDFVYKIAHATEMTNDVSSIENGFYLSIIKNNLIEYRKLKDSHADTWLSFKNLLSWIIEELPGTSGLGQHKSVAIDLISSLKSSLSRSGADKGNWLSIIRNKINYQHSYGVWYPYKGAIHNSSTGLKNSKWLKDLEISELNDKNEIEMLFNISNMILSFMYHLLDYGYSRAGKTSIPWKNGTFHLINQIKVA